MDRKNILYCSLAVFAIITVAITTNLSNKIDSSMTHESKPMIYKESNSLSEIAIDKTKNEIKTEEASNKEMVISISSEYSENELNRALMYQDKDWAKDDTINEAAWDAASKTKRTATEQLVDAPEKPIENNTHTSLILAPHESITQDEKNNNSMIE